MTTWSSNIRSCSNRRFLGHISNRGLMSYRGITVMINIVTIIPYVGNSITKLIRRSSYVTINRILIIHYGFGFILGVLIIVHLVLPHNFSSSSPLINNNSFSKTNYSISVDSPLFSSLSSYSLSPFHTLYKRD